MNKWLGSGRLTDNPVLKYDSDRAVFATFTIMCVRDGKIPGRAARRSILSTANVPDTTRNSRKTF